ncbi:MAG: hypothetical protein QJR12_04780 [Mycobacterium sp.]|uniref:hypothetical protein n=1 Tax=Mycobacterium sp. TaxID=1785 RepID=UPI002611E59E|nr:hypothetical protein [Mycobacterium sp.]MDI3313611.1 hypothetical protein [Mycobacterium sp.]
MPVVIAAGVTAVASGFDWSKILGIPASTLAFISLFSLFVGIIHPAAVQKPIYWHEGGKTWMRLTVKNRSFGFDRHVEKIMLYRVPGFFKRTFTRKWRQQSLPAVPWGVDLPTPNKPTVLAKRVARLFEFELRTPAGGSTKVALDKAFRVDVKCGSRRSRRKKIKFRDL